VGTGPLRLFSFLLESLLLSSRFTPGLHLQPRSPANCSSVVVTFPDGFEGPSWSTLRGFGLFRRKISIGELYEALERDYLINGRKSLRDLAIRWHKHLETTFAALPAQSLTTDQISVYVARRFGEKASNATVNRELATLKRMYKLAIKTGRLKFGEQPYFPMLRENNVRKGFLKDAEYSALARTTGEKGLWLRALFELAFTYGWRKSELLGMEVAQLDFSERTITLYVGTTKNKQGRLVEMTDKAFELLSSLARAKAPGEKVFTRGKNKRPVRSFRRAWETATKAAGCPDLLFHDLRRTGVRNLIRAGVREKQAMEITGHKTRSTFERYNISDPADMRRAIGLLEKAQAARRQQGLFEQARLFPRPDQDKIKPN